MVQLLEAFKALIATGRTKLVGDLAAIFGIVYMEATGCNSLEATGGIVLVTAMFLFARKLQEKEEWSVKRADQDRANLPPYDPSSAP